MKTKEVDSVDMPFKRIVINNTLVLKLHIKYFKEISIDKERYGQLNLHFVYMKKCTPFPPHCDMNYFIKDGYIYIYCSRIRVGFRRGS